MARNLTNRLWQSFLQLNLYKRSSSTPETNQKEFIATRIYVCLLSMTILIVTIILAFTVRTITKIEHTPSHLRYSYLTSKYPDTLHCPCANIGISYHRFVTTHVKFHQVCSSSFIQQTWIDMIYTQYNTSSSDDFRLALSFFWQLIKGFCLLSYTTWNDTLTGFETSHLFSPIAIAEHILQRQVKTTLQNQVNLAQTKLAHDLLSIRRLTSGNQFVSALATNYYLRYPPQHSNSTSSPKVSPRTFNDCSCLNVKGCPHSATIKDSYGHPIIIPGMIDDCLIIDGTLASTLECYYNQTCLSLLHPSLPISIKPLTNIQNKHFLINSTIEILLNVLMIDEMTNDIHFDFYYSKCNVSYCSYSYKHRFHILYIITTIIAIYGGLSFVLKFISPYNARILLKWKNRNVSANNVAHDTRVNQQNRLHIIFNHLRLLPTYIRQTLMNLNLFEQETLRTPNNIHRERLLTRIFIILLIISCLTAGFYTFLIAQNQTVTIRKPSVDTYHELYNNYSDALQCLCANMSVSYSRFLNVTFILHQVCSSDLVSSRWLKYLTLFDPVLLPSEFVSTIARDFRTAGVSYFQLLSTFCSLAERNIEITERIFINNQFINVYLPTLSAFNQQTQSMIESYINNIRNDFKRTFDWIYITVIINYLLTGANSNFYMTIANNDTVIITELECTRITKINHHGYGSIGSYKCPRDSFACQSTNLLYINGSDIYEFEQIFSELPIGCIPLIGFLDSTFAWWYNETYIKNIQTTYSIVIPSQSLPNIKPLVTSVLTRFETSNLEYLVKEMFIETLIKHTDFNQFYHACAPVSCTYTVIQRRNIIVALFLFIAIYSGIKQILKILVLTSGKLIYFFIDWRNNRDVQSRLVSTRIRVNQFFRLIYQSIININLYHSTSTDDIIIKQERIYTRVYLILFTCCISVIIFYTAFIQRTLTQTYMLSSMTDYQHLLEVHLDEINCPCTRISIPYNDLITELQVSEYHWACSSDVVYRTLMAGEFILEGILYPNGKDFRNFRKIFIDGLEHLCILAQQSVNNSITMFRDSTVFFNQLISPDQFYNETNITLARFIQKTPMEFARTLDLIRTNTQGNALMAVFSTNWKFVIHGIQGDEKNISFHSESIAYIDVLKNTSCSCATSQFCAIPAQIFYGNGTLQYTFKSFKLGCNSLETILLSSLSCFYSMECIYEFRQALDIRPYFLILGQSKEGDDMEVNASLTRFNINDTIERLAYEMFIESWIIDVSYEKFFNSCSPTYCTHKIYYRFDGIEVLTTFLSVYAGLSFGIHFLVPYLIKMIKKIRNRIRVTPVQ